MLPVLSFTATRIPGPKTGTKECWAITIPGWIAFVWNGGRGCTKPIQIGKDND